MSSPASTPNAKPTNGLTARDIELLAIAMQSMKDTNIQLDYEKFAEMAGLTANSARVIWPKLRKKLASTSGIDGTPASAASQAAKPKAKKGGRKRKAEDAGIAGGDGDAIGSPQSPTAMATERKKKRVKKEAKAEIPAQPRDGDGVPVKTETEGQAEVENVIGVKTEQDAEGGF